MTFSKRPLPETKSAPFRGASTDRISLAGAAAHEADDEGGCGQNDQHGPDAHDPDRQLLDAGDNRTTFYPQLHQLLTRYFSGIPYDLSLPGDGQ